MFFPVYIFYAIRSNFIYGCDFQRPRSTYQWSSATSGSKVWKYAAERGTEDARSAVFCLDDLSAKVGQTQFVSWRDWGDFQA